MNTFPNLPDKPDDNMMSFLPLTVKQKSSGKAFTFDSSSLLLCGMELFFFFAIFDSEDIGLTYRDRRAEGKVEPGVPSTWWSCHISLEFSDFISFKRNEPNKPPLFSGSQRAALCTHQRLKNYCCLDLTSKDSDVTDMQCSPGIHFKANKKQL